MQGISAKLSSALEGGLYLCRIFSNNLEKDVIIWFYQLKPNNISLFECVGP